MSTAVNQKTNVLVVRDYKIGDMTYIVKAVIKDGAKEDAATKVRRLIRNDLQRANRYKYFSPGLLTANGFYGIMIITCLSGCRNRRQT